MPVGLTALGILLATITATAKAQSQFDFSFNGNPYEWGEVLPGQLLEL